MPSLRGKLTYENFVVARSNLIAYSAARRFSLSAIARSSLILSNPLYIWGPVGTGKTHLANAIAADIRAGSRRKVLFFTCEQFANAIIDEIRKDQRGTFRTGLQGKVVIIDDIDWLGGRLRTQEEFLICLAGTYAYQGAIVLNSCYAPHQIPWAVDVGLRRFFKAGSVVEIKRPELKTLIETAQSHGASRSRNPSAAKIMEMARRCATVRELQGRMNRYELTGSV